jgi:protein-tyrosine phosphatase
MSHPDKQYSFQYDYISCPLGGGMFLLSCPGRQGVDDLGRKWNRNLDDDLHALSQENITGLITLLPLLEMQNYNVTELPEAVTRLGWYWWHWPIADRDVADYATVLQIQQTMPSLEKIWKDGHSIALHCAAGLGRTGTLAAQFLVAQGIEPDQAIARIRKIRPGSIETKEQEWAIREQRL